MTPDVVQKPEDLDGLDKEGLVAFLNGEREDKVDLWNAWREATAPSLVEWAEVDLEGADLSWAGLEGADLRRARLRDVALSDLEQGGLRGVKLYRTYFWGVLGLRYEQFLDERGQSTIWEETEGRFSQAKNVYKTLKGYFEDAGDYEGANWAYGREQVMEKLMYSPRWVRWLYPRWRGKWNEDFCKPALFEWLRLELAEKVAGYGMSLLRPIVWLGVVLFGCALVYRLTGAATATPGCGYAELSVTARAGCAPTKNLLDNLLFSLAAMTTADVGVVQVYKSGVGWLMTIETLVGIALTGLVGFVLGNRLRYS